MEIIVGSMNPAKIQAVQAVFTADKVMGIEVQSDVSSQPFSDVETKQGAINRAKYSAASTEEAFGIGLEGGVMYMGSQLFLCSWGAFVTPSENLFTASGARIPLPSIIQRELEAGVELGDVMDWYSQEKEVGKSAGAIGILTNGIVSRQEMFSHVISLLRGQWEA